MQRPSKAELILRQLWQTLAELTFEIVYWGLLLYMMALAAGWTI